MHKSLFIPLILFSFVLLQGCKEESNPVTPPSEHFDPEGWVITNDSLQAVLVVWQGTIQAQWEGNPVSSSFIVQTDTISEHFRIKFLNEEKEVQDPPLDTDYTFGFNLQDSSVVNLLPDEAGGWGFHIKGKSPGNTSVEFQVLHLGHVDIRTPYIPIVVTE